MLPEYSRNEPPLKDGRLLVFPYVIKPRDHALTIEQVGLLRSCQPICDLVMDYHPGHRFIRGELVMLPPGVTLGWHRDPMWFHEHCRRIHVPVISNPDCFQLWDGERRHLEVGKMYEINNRQRHSAVNGGSEGRVHMIFDICDDRIWTSFISSGGNPNSMTCNPAID